jgi:hypothetical protein
MSYGIKINNQLKEGRIDVKHNGTSAGEITPTQDLRTSFEVNDVFAIKVPNTDRRTCFINISSTLFYNLLLSIQDEPDEPGWILTIIGPTPHPPPNPETDVNVTVGENEPPD